MALQCASPSSPSPPCAPPPPLLIHNNGATGRCTLMACTPQCHHHRASLFWAFGLHLPQAATLVGLPLELAKDGAGPKPFPPLLWMQRGRVPTVLPQRALPPPPLPTLVCHLDQNTFHQPANTTNGATCDWGGVIPCAIRDWTSCSLRRGGDGAVPRPSSGLLPCPSLSDSHCVSPPCPCIGVGGRCCGLTAAPHRPDPCTCVKDPAPLSAATAGPRHSYKWGCMRRGCPLHTAPLVPLPHLGCNALQHTSTQQVSRHGGQCQHTHYTEVHRGG
jgi:hypothetical protein